MLRMLKSPLAIRTAVRLATAASALALFSAVAPMAIAQEPAKGDPLVGYMETSHGQLLKAAEHLLREEVKPHLTSSDAESLQAANEVIRLLDMKREPMPIPSTFVGKWQVRSIQSSNLGVYAYPFFSCEIRREGAKGVAFQKHSGSQRRVGVLLPYQADSLLFLGGSYYEDDKPQGYSNLRGGKAAGGDSEREDRDSVGQLYQLAPGHLLMIFAPISGRGEIYELKKS
jgi:hypothetical protein